MKGGSRKINAIQIRFLQYPDSNIKAQFLWIFCIELYFRVDTMDADSKEILSMIEVDEKLSHSHMTRGKSSDQTAEKYYSQLDVKTLDRLYKLYEMDFILFDFSPDKYYNYVKHNNWCLTFNAFEVLKSNKEDFNQIVILSFRS